MKLTTDHIEVVGEVSVLVGFPRGPVLACSFVFVFVFVRTGRRFLDRLQ